MDLDWEKKMQEQHRNGVNKCVIDFEIDWLQCF